MKFKYILTAAGVFLALTLAIALTGQASSSTFVGEVQTPALSDNSTALNSRSTKSSAIQSHRQKMRFACFAGSLGKCRYDSDCCSGSCVYLNTCGGYCCYP